jgi:shikimate dehydrogenase
MYGRETPFMALARSARAQVADGLGMLVEQAAEAFYLWRGVRPETKSVIQKMRAL